MDDYDNLLLGLIEEGALNWPKGKEQMKKEKLNAAIQESQDKIIDKLLILGADDEEERVSLEGVTMPMNEYIRIFKELREAKRVIRLIHSQLNRYEED